MIFEWDPKKAILNEVKHGVSFTEAMSIFGDPLSLTIPDLNNSQDEDRFVTLGLSDQSRILVVSHTDRNEKIRLISARLATPKEKRDYSEGSAFDIRIEEMKAEYDFSKGVRGKYSDQFKSGTNVILLDPDVLAHFPDSKAVNEALRNLISKSKKSKSKRSESA